MNKDQVIGDKQVPLNRDSKNKSKDNEGNIRTRYERIIKKARQACISKMLPIIYKHYTYSRIIIV